jgi:hypothetical protein
MLQAPAGAGADSQSSAVASSAARPASAQSTGDTARADRTPRASAPTEESPTISGPSFLGLNEPAPRKRGSLSIDPGGANSRNLDYLLDDEEEPRRGGAGKYVLILVALGLAVGLGYLRWRGQIQGWLGSDSKKPSATAQNTDASASSQPPSNVPNTSTSCAPVTGMPGVCQIGSTSAGSSQSGSSQSGSSQSGSSQSSAGQSSAKQPVSAQPIAAAPSPSSASSSAASSSSAPAASTPGQTTGDANAETVSGAANAGAANSAPATNAAGPGSAPAANAPSNNAAADSAGADAASTAKSAPAETPASKPAAAEKPAKAVDPVSEAQKYLYGKGVAQSCDRGMRILKPAADQANAKAMIEMGALYSAGLCTPRDLPTAYRWFAMALRKDPDNQAVQTDLQKLWGEMTQPERQLAIRLSQ